MYDPVVILLADCNDQSAFLEVALVRRFPELGPLRRAIVGDLSLKTLLPSATNADSGFVFVDADYVALQPAFFCFCGFLFRFSFASLAVGRRGCLGKSYRRK